MKKHILALSALLLVAICANAAPRNTLFNNGKSTYTIVVADDASASEKFAAKELQEWISKVSGATLPIDAEGEKGHRIVVGYNPVTAELFPGTQAPAPADESFTVQSEGGDIFLWGGRQRGTLYAAYSFLEEELGCRWYTSTASLAPKRNKWTFRNLQRHEEPAITARNDFNYDAFNPLWAARNRSNAIMGEISADEDSLGGGYGYWGCHTLGNNLLKSSTYFADHPEYYSLNAGGFRTPDQVCLSNPDVLPIVIDNLRKYMRANPGNLVFDVSQNDNNSPCQCERCQAIKDQFGGEESGIMIWFVNQVAEAVKDEFPDKYVGTFAYQYTRKAPTGIRPADNVVVRLCSIEECQSHEIDGCELNRAFLEDLRAWSAIAPHLYIWDYVATYTQYLAISPNIWSFKSRIQAFRDNNAIGVMPQGNYQVPGGDWDPLKTWVLAKLLWNPEEDTDELIDDFMNGYYGRAGKPLRKYLDLEKKCLAGDDVHLDCFPYGAHPLIDDAFIARGKKLFRQAYRAVQGDSTLVARVEVAELPLCFEQMLYNPKQGMEEGAMDFLDRVCKREKVNRLCEFGGFRTLDVMHGAIELISDYDLSLEKIGDLIFYSPRGAQVNFQKCERKIEGAILASYYFNRENGKDSAYLQFPSNAGGNDNASFVYIGTVKPGEEYEATASYGWESCQFEFEGFDPAARYTMLVTSISPETLRFKIVPRVAAQP